MGKHTTHVLTQTEIECGVTLETVAELLPKGLFIEGGQKFVLPAGTPPALALSAARCAFGDTRDVTEFAGFNQLGQPVYTHVPDSTIAARSAPPK